MHNFCIDGGEPVEFSAIERSAGQVIICIEGIISTHEGHQGNRRHVGDGDGQRAKRPPFLIVSSIILKLK